MHTRDAGVTRIGCSEVEGQQSCAESGGAGAGGAAAARRVKPVHPELKNERQGKERTDTARRLRWSECDNGLQIGWAGERPWRGNGERGREVLWIGTVGVSELGGAADAFVAGKRTLDGTFTRTDANLTVKPSRDPPHSRARRGTVAHILARPLAGCERVDCAVTTIILHFALRARCHGCLVLLQRGSRAAAGTAGTALETQERP